MTDDGNDDEPALSRAPTKPLPTKLVVELDDGDSRKQLAEFLEELAKLVRTRGQLKITVE